MSHADTDKPDGNRKHSARSKYTPELGQQVCEAIAKGSTLQSACDDSVVKPSTFLLWCHTHAELAEEYARARREQNEAVDDEIRELAAQTDSENAKAMETKFRMLTWIAGKRSPKQFGERVGLEHSGKDGGPLKVEVEIVGGLE